MRWLTRFFRRGKLDTQLDSELRFHVEQQIADNLAAGMSPAEARRRALAQFGGLEFIKEETRDARGLRLLDAIFQDLRYGLRQVRRKPLLTFAVVLALSVGIGLNTTVFTLVDGVWFHSPAQKNPTSFVWVLPKYSGWFATEDQFRGFTIKDFQAIRARAKSLQDVAGFNGVGGAQMDNDPSKIPLALVTCNFFAVYGVGAPLTGRPLIPQDCAAPGSAPVAVISEGLWRTQYAADPLVVGKEIRINQHPYTIVGVERINSPIWMNADVWVPYTMEAQFYNGYDGFQQHPDWPWLTLIGRLKTGFSRADASADLKLIESQQDRLIPGRKTSLLVTNGSLFQDPQYRSLGLIVIPLIMGPMALVLLVACTNVAMLLLSHAAARRGEIAIRLALGASRARLLAMLVAERMITAAAAGAISIYLAWELPKAFWGLFLHQNGYAGMHPDWIAFAYLAGLTLFAGCIAGLAPARESLRIDLVTALKGREGSATPRSRLRSALVIAQIAMSFVLVAAGVMFARLQRSITSEVTGYEMRQVMTVPLTVAMPPYTQDSAAAFYRTVTERLRELPGVRSVSYARFVPFTAPEQDEIRLLGEAQGQGRKASIDAVSPNFFRTLGIPIVLGRAFQATDAPANAAAKVAVVSQAFARAFWNGQDPLGKVIEMPDNTQLLVVGVARDTISENFGAPDGPRLYIPQSPRSFRGSLMVRFEGEANLLALAIEKTIRGLDPQQLVIPQTLQSILDQKAENIQPLTETVLFVACLAVVLAVSGVYGVVAFSVSQRTREFGIRMALGATRSRILGSILISGARQIAIGLLLGLLLAIPAAWVWVRLTQGTRIQTHVLGLFTFCLAAALLLGAALLACYIPARRAMRVDPMVALRYE